MSSNLSSRFPLFKYLAQTLTNRFKERDFRIVKKYHCWQQNKSSWKNQYPSRQGGRRRGVLRSAPVAHQSGRWAVLTISGNCFAFLSRFWGSFEIFSPSVPEISTSIIGTTRLDKTHCIYLQNIYQKSTSVDHWSTRTQCEAPKDVVSCSSCDCKPVKHFFVFFATVVCFFILPNVLIACQFPLSRNLCKNTFKWPACDLYKR